MEIEDAQALSNRSGSGDAIGRAGRDTPLGPAGLSALLDDAPALIAAHEGPEHVCVYANAGHRATMGHRPLIGRPLREAVPEFAGLEVFERFDAVYASGETIGTREVRVVLDAADGRGEPRWFRQTLKPWYDERGALRGVASFAHDVTDEVEERRLAEQGRDDLARALEAGGGVAAWNWRRATDTITADARFARLHGVDPADAACGLPRAAVVAAIHDDDRARVVAAIERAIATGEDFFEEYRVRGAEGRLTRIAARGRCLRDEAGRAGRFAGVVVDVTGQATARERAEASEAALRASEERRRRAMEAGRVGTFEFHPREGRSEWDAMTVAIFGFDGGEAVALEAIAARIHPDDRAAWEADVAAALDPAGDGVHQIEMRITRASDGETRWIEARGRTAFEHAVCAGPDPRPGDARAGREAVLMLGTVRDITERKRSEERLDVALKAADMGAWDVDLATGHVWRSPRHDAIFGYPSRLPGWRFETFLEHVEEVDRARVRASFARAVAEIVPWRFTCRIRRADGETRWIATEGAPQLDAAGRAVRLSGVILDVTERKRTEERLGRVERLEAVEQMAGGFAHDFGNLLGAIRLSAEVAKLLPERAGAQIEAVLAAAERGADLVERIVAFARREPGTVESVALDVVIGGLGGLLADVAGRTVRLDLDLAPDLAAYCDPRRLEAALVNLVLNARDAIVESGRGGMVRVLARPGRVPGMVAVEVVDDGPGMSEAVRRRAADPFFTTKEARGGSGLGLAMVAAFASASGGELEIESAPGRGATIRVTLPTGSPPPRSIAAARAEAVPGPPDARVLLVEDDVALREASAIVLDAAGYAVRAEAEATRAAAILRSGEGVDALVTDVLLPGGMNGFELAALARRLRPGLAVVYVSGFAEVPYAPDAPEGVFLRKPVGRETLLATLAQALLDAPGET